MPGKPALSSFLARPQTWPSLLPVCPEALSSLCRCGGQDSCRPAPAKGLGRAFPVQHCAYQTRKTAASRQNEVEEKEGLGRGENRGLDATLR